MEVYLSMYDLLLPSGTKGLREQNICETKNCEIKVCELDLENWKNTLTLTLKTLKDFFSFKTCFILKDSAAKSFLIFP